MSKSEDYPEYDALVEIGFQRGLQAVKDAMRTVDPQPIGTVIGRVLAAIDDLAGPCKPTFFEEQKILDDILDDTNRKVDLDGTS